MHRGMHGVEFILLVEKLKPRHVPDDVAGVGLDREVWHRGDQTPALLVEVAGVGERQGLLRLQQHRLGELRWRLALRMEMTCGRGDSGRGGRRGVALEHRGRHGEGGQALHELTTGRHETFFRFQGQKGVRVCGQPSGVAKEYGWG